ncbi:hypothetical protein OROGR_014661 [Orobanche gracilis]
MAEVGRVLEDPAPSHCGSPFSNAGCCTTRCTNEFKHIDVESSSTSSARCPTFNTIMGTPRVASSTSVGCHSSYATKEV